MPHNLRKLKLYTTTCRCSRASRSRARSSRAYSHVVDLPSGGSIVIDHTEALVSIDINSARATKGDDIETTALNTNLEAADEIARQLRCATSAA
jgi:ribonuclease E